jgi:hypothetical protein
VHLTAICQTNCQSALLRRHRVSICAIPAAQTPRALQIGPRLELQLFKVQEGLAEGRVLYHSLETRSPEEVAAQQVAVDGAAQLKAERRRQQEENVRKKAHEQARAQAAKDVRPRVALMLLFS